MWRGVLKEVSFSFFDHSAGLVGSFFPDQGLNLGHHSESTKFYALDNQEIPKRKL